MGRDSRARSCRRLPSETASMRRLTILPSTHTRRSHWERTIQNNIYIYLAWHPVRQRIFSFLIPPLLGGGRLFALVTGQSRAVKPRTSPIVWPLFTSVVDGCTFEMHPTHAEERKRMLPAPELGKILFQGGLNTAAKLWPLLSLLIYQVLFPRSLQFERRLAPSIAGLSLHYLLYSTLLLASASRNSISPTSLQRVAIIPFFLIVTVMIFVFFFSKFADRRVYRYRGQAIRPSSCRDS